MKINSSGFTLLEVTLAVALLAVLALFVAQTTQKATEAKKKVQAELDRTIELRDSLQIMARDFSLAFNYRDVNLAVQNAANLQSAPTPSPGVQGFTPTQEKIVTQFLGEEDKVHFSTLSNIRSSEDQPISDQAEVGYFLKSCRNRKDKSKTTNCLWRRIDYLIDDKIREGGQESVLLENVTKFSLRYLGPGHSDEWIRSWLSDGTLEDTMRGKFPTAVEISIEINDDRVTPPRKLSMQTVAPIKFPNNKEEPGAQGPTPTP